MAEKECCQEVVTKQTEPSTPSDQGEEAKQEQALSKNQLKKQLRLQRWAETKKERRKKEREKIKEKKRQRIEEAKQEGVDEVWLGTKKRKMRDPQASKVQVAIDCSFDSYMTEPDIKKLIKQIQRCYAENRKSAKPLQLYVCSLRDKTKQLMDTLVQGYQNWDIHLRAEDPDAAFGPSNVVYLAAESPNVLQDLDPSKAYIIGGLVDHNHHKGICYKQVVEKGWSHAQLPIGDYVKLNSRKVLAVNHVYEIILAYIQLGNWHDAFFQVLPNRKVKAFISQKDEEETSSKCESAIENQSMDKESQLVAEDLQTRTTSSEKDADDQSPRIANDAEGQDSLEETVVSETDNARIEMGDGCKVSLTEDEKQKEINDDER